MSATTHQFGIRTLLVIAAMAFAILSGLGVWASAGHADEQAILAPPMPTGESAPVFADSTDVNHEAMLQSSY